MPTSYANKCGYYILQSVHTLGTTKLTGMTEAKLFAVALLAISMRYFSIFDKTSVPRIQLPASEIQLRWFLAIMKQLLLNSNEDFNCYDFGSCWFHMLHTTVLSMPFDLPRSEFLWELLEFCHTHFGFAGFEFCMEYFKEYMPRHPHNIKPTAFWHMQEAWEITINFNLKIAVIGLSMSMARELKDDARRDSRMIVALLDTRYRADSIESCQVQQLLYVGQTSERPSDSTNIRLYR
jgi:hypothetical protein